MATGFKRVKARVPPGDMRGNRIISPQSIDPDEEGLVIVTVVVVVIVGTTSRCSAF